MPLTLEGEQHPDRDAQFQYINEQVKARQDAAEPVISVEAKKKKKKKEQLGQLPAPGREWRPKGSGVGDRPVQRASTATLSAENAPGKLPPNSDLPQRPPTTLPPGVRIEGGRAPPRHIMDHLQLQF